MENLPSDITLDILSRLPIESVLLLQSNIAFKSLRSLTSGFIKYGLLFSIRNRLDRGFYYAEYDEINNIDLDKQQCSYKTPTKVDQSLIRDPAQFVMVGSCNGLVCFVISQLRIGNFIYIWNPITRENIELPGVYPERKRRFLSMVCGFGYIHSTNEYKIVRIYYDPKVGDEGKVQIYTIGGGTSTGWRDVGDITNYFGAPGIFANGALHWMEHYEKHKVVAFDLADEEFRWLPSLPSHLCNARVKLVLLGENLCAYHRRRSNRVDIWALKKNREKKKTSDNVKEQDEYHSWSWSIEFIIKWEGKANAVYEPFALTNKNEVLLWYNGVLSCYDPKTATLKKLWNDDTAFRVQAIPHINSMVSSNALAEKSAEVEDTIS